MKEFKSDASDLRVIAVTLGMSGVAKGAKYLEFGGTNSVPVFAFGRCSIRNLSPAQRGFVTAGAIQLTFNQVMGVPIDFKTAQFLYRFFRREELLDDSERLRPEVIQLVRAAA